MTKPRDNPKRRWPEENDRERNVVFLVGTNITTQESRKEVPISDETVNGAAEYMRQVTCDK